MEAKRRIILTVMILLVLSGIFYFTAMAITKYTGFSITGNAVKIDNFAKCLSDKGAVLYIRAGCIHCANQEALFKDSLEYLNIIDCASSPDKCTEEGITAVPTWKIDGKLYTGEQTYNDLEQLIGCKF